MVDIAYINPLSNEGRAIVKNFGNLDQINEKNEHLIDVVTHTNNQRISDNSLIPQSVKELALKKVQWYIERKNNKNYVSNDFEYLFNYEITNEDTVAFHLLSQAIAYRFNNNSRENRLFVDMQGLLIEYRLSKLPNVLKRELIKELLIDLMEEGFIDLYSIKDAISTKKLSIFDLFLDDGEIVLEKDDFLARFSDDFSDRDPERMYNILIGTKVKELIISKFLMQKTEDYIKKIKEMSSIIDIHPLIKELGEELNDMIPELLEKYRPYYGSGPVYQSMGIAKLNPDAFPPCIKKTIEGVSAGGRNDAIVLLLTSFASYARLHPGIFGSESDVKVSDIDKDLSITENEILPLIFEAAENCRPPLFSDQPQEKMNIISKLGFGMHDELDINHEGETTWYTPMSCEKIKIHLPQLCKPDKSCKGINNPLSCYNRKRYNLSKEDNSSNQ